eukprot:TRINITY_DN716_c2_g1_i3.p1 TRINITY_DN716_c2_g1~~TRINITY_DN716_c2_g1_i3.p1  ORF type:complete len:268 (-),score=88.73 TRINITY_DN716_c2_g1_i3:233-1036(-)
MVERGLVPEVVSLYERFLSKGIKLHESTSTVGISQSIGFKEFFPFFQELDKKPTTTTTATATTTTTTTSDKNMKDKEHDSDNANTGNNNDNKHHDADDGNDVNNVNTTTTPTTNPRASIIQRIDENKVLLDQCIDKLKTHTRWYASKQQTWIRNHFIKQSMPPVYLFDCTPYIRSATTTTTSTTTTTTSTTRTIPDEGLWDDQILNLARDIVKCFSNGTPIEAVPLQPDPDRNQVWTKHVCERCNKTLNGPKELEAHLRTKLHKRRK